MFWLSCAFYPCGSFCEYFNLETQVFLAVGNSFEFISLIIFSPLFSQGSSHIDVVSYRGILYFYCLFLFISFPPPSVWVMSSASSSNPLLSFPFLLSFLISKSSVMLSNYPFNRLYFCFMNAISFLLSLRMLMAAFCCLSFFKAFIFLNSLCVSKPISPLIRLLSCYLSFILKAFLR